MTISREEIAVRCYTAFLADPSLAAADGDYPGLAKWAFVAADAFMDHAERIDARPAKSTLTPAPVPPPATTPVPEVLTPDVPEGSTIAQLAAEQRASMGLTASVGGTQYFKHDTTPAPEAKRPTLADVERSAEAFANHKGDIPHSPSDAWMDGWLARDRAVAHDGIAHSTNAPCPPPVAGSGDCAKEYAELVRAARLTVGRVERLGSVNSVESLRGALKDLDAALSRPVRP